MGSIHSLESRSGRLAVPRRPDRPVSDTSPETVALPLTWPPRMLLKLTWLKYTLMVWVDGAASAVVANASVSTRPRTDARADLRIAFPLASPTVPGSGPRLRAVARGVTV